MRGKRVSNVMGKLFLLACSRLRRIKDGKAAALAGWLQYRVKGGIAHEHMQLTDDELRPCSAVRLTRGWTARIHHDWDFPDDVLSTWRNLADAHGPLGIFVEPDWFNLWWTIYGDPLRMCVVVLRQNQMVRGVFPLIVERPISGAAPVLKAMTNEVPFDVLIDPGHLRETLQAFAELLSQCGPTDPVFFDEMMDSSSCGKELLDELHAAHFPCLSHATPNNPFIELRAQSWVEYTATLHSQLQNNLKKGRRRAEREGELTFNIHTSEDGLDELLTETFAVEAASWKGEQGSAMQCTPMKERWYRSLGRWAAQRGELQLATLRLNGRLLAFDFALVHRKCVLTFKTGYDQHSAAHLSPGNIMRFELLRFLFEKTNYERYDFMGVCAPWKMQWTNKTDTIRSLSVYPKSLRGWTRYMVEHGWKQPLKHSETIVTLARRMNLVGTNAG